MEVKDLISVLKVCRGSHALYREPLAVKKLLQAVVYGDLKNAEKMISKNPEILLERGTVKDYSGRVHLNRTAYQLALGACDYNVEDKKGNMVVNGMVEMIEKHFKKLPGKKAQQIHQIMHDQYIRQFPEDYEKLEAKRVADDSAALHRIINVIAELKDENECVSVSNLENEIHKISTHRKVSTSR